MNSCSLRGCDCNSMKAKLRCRRLQNKNKHKTQVKTNEHVRAGLKAARLVFRTAKDALAGDPASCKHDDEQSEADFNAHRLHGDSSKRHTDRGPSRTAWTRRQRCSSCSCCDDRCFSLLLIATIRPINNEGTAKHNASQNNTNCCAQPP